MGRIPAFTLALVALLATSCQRGGPIGSNHYPPTPDNVPIEVFLSKAPTRPYEEVGYFRNKVGMNPNDSITWGQSRARTVGGQAIIANLNAGTWKEGNMADIIVIRWTDEAVPLSKTLEGVDSKDKE